MKKRRGFLRWVLSAIKVKGERKYKGVGSPDEFQKTISVSLEKNVDTVKELFHDSEDLKIRRFQFPVGKEKNMRRAALIFVDGLADGKILSNEIVEPLMYGGARAGAEGRKEINCDEDIKNVMLAAGDVRNAEDFEDALFMCLMGDCIMFIDGYKGCFIIGARGYDKRALKPSDTEMSVRGPKESFIENLRTNTALVRRRIKNTELCFDNMVVGRQTKTPVSVVYMNNIADKALVSEVKKRIRAIDVDSVVSSGYIEQYIEDEPTSMFSTVGYTERPDVLAAKLLEGRVGVIIDGTPYVLTMPQFFAENFQTAEDYSSNFLSVTVLRLLRYSAFFVSVFAPAIYVALTTFHQEMIPTSLLLTMGAAREGIPFSAFFEAMFMVVVFEILKEAGVRLPQPIGQTISIVGALVMGEAAVSAGFVSAPLVIVIAFTAVSGFVVSTFSAPVLLLRFIFLFLGGFLGGYGIALGALVLFVRLADIESFGYRYLAPIVPFNLSDQKDTLIRAPLWLMRTRPHLLAKKNKVRENTPVPPDGK